MRYLIFLMTIFSFNITAQVVNTISNGDYLLKTEIFFDVNNNELDNSVVYTLYKNNTELFTISDLMYRNEPLPTVGIFDNGVLFFVYSLSGKVSFYDKTGVLFASQDLDVEYNIQYESSVLLDINQDIAGILISSPEEPKSRLYIYNSYAEKINVIEVAGFQGSGIKFIDENIIAVSTYYWLDELVENTFFYSKGGELLGKIPMRFENCDFNGKYFLGYYNKRAFLVGLDNYQILFDFKPIENEMIIKSIMLNDVMIIVSSKYPNLKDGKWYYKNLRMQKFSIDGNKLEEKEIETKEFIDLKLISENESFNILIDGIQLQ